MLHLQGDLQAVFDTLYDMGVIEPILNKDWRPVLEEISQGSPRLMHAIRIVNSCQNDRTLLRAELSKMDWKSLECLAMEVAREYADYHMRQTVH